MGGKIVFVAGAGLVLVALSACATAEQRAERESPPDYSDDPRVVCEMIKRPGSTLSERVCELKDYRDDRQAQSQQGHREVVLRSTNPL